MPQSETLALEARWQRAWQQADCFRAPASPTGVKYFNYDSGPFTNGELHLGHVRTYVLGDVMARYQRALGKCVLYATDFDAFGLPNELAAQASGVSPFEMTASVIEDMTRDLRALGISYDWPRVPRSCDPGYYRWTQWLFLELYRSGLIEHREANARWCDRCATTLARMQVEDGTCWRCGGSVTTRRMRQWHVLMSRYEHDLRASLDALSHWSATARNMVRAYIDEEPGDEQSPRARRHDWLVSRQRAWGTPIPIVHCGACGTVPVPERDLPVVLPRDLDWRLGARALVSSAAFATVDCPVCRRRARRETDTLDCFFDGVWSWLACLAPLDGEPPLTHARLVPWLPLDWFHSGFDTFFDLHLRRFLGRFLHSRGAVDDPEVIRGHFGHAMVLASGRKMSKHLGNMIGARAVTEQHGADAVRVAILAPAGPQRPVSWEPAAAAEAHAFLARVARLVTSWVDAGHAPSTSATTPSRAALATSHRVRVVLDETSAFYASYRPNAALHALTRALADLEDFAHRRIAARRVATADRQPITETLAAFVVALAPCAPHLAEEMWARLGQQGLACHALWPVEGRCVAAP